MADTETLHFETSSIEGIIVITMGAEASAVLSEDDALRAALVWREHLQGRVRLEVDLYCDSDLHATGRAAPSRFTLVDRFEWVTFVFPSSHSNIAEITAAARAATIVWYALTCCPGFSGTENPHFWRRVFTELAKPPTGRRTQLPITEAVRFFDDPEKPFPRIRIVPPSVDVESCVRGFLRGPVHAQLEPVLQSLEPFIRTARWSRAVPVAVDDMAASDLAQFLPTLQVRCTPSAQGALLPPHFRLEAVYLQGRDLASLDAIQKVVVHSRATMIVRQCETADVYSLVSAPEAIHSQLRRRLRIHTVDLIRPTESASCFAGLCAAIPGSEWISGVRVFSFGDPNPKEYKYYRANIAWLAYAMFHPDTNHGVALSEFDLSSSRFPSDLIRIFQKMSTGNNLEAMITNDTKSPPSDGYYSGRIRATTVARAKPTRFSHSVYTFDADKWMTICATTVRPELLPSWVAVVLPGVGMVWVPRKSILSVTKRPVAAPSLRRLRLAIGVDPHLAFMSFLYRLGHTLEFLEMTEIAFASSIAISTIFYLCPKLKSLRTAFASARYHDNGLGGPEKPTRLEELELTVVGDVTDLLELNHLQSPVFSNLQAVRIVMSTANSFAHNRDVFLTLLDSIPSLQYADWHENVVVTRRGKTIESYDDRQRRSRKLLGDLSTWSPNLLNGPNESGVRWAFLSVVYHEASRGQSLVGHLGNDVLRNILSFVPKTAPREVCISGGRKLRRASLTASPA